MQKLKVNGLPKTDWKQADGQTDGGDFITFFANAVINYTQLRTEANI